MDNDLQSILDWLETGVEIPRAEEARPADRLRTELEEILEGR